MSTATPETPCDPQRWYESAWLVWMTIAGSVLVCVLLALQHAHQERENRQAKMLLMEVVRAHADVQIGVMHLVLGQQGLDPWDQAEGLVLLRQALEGYRRVVIPDTSNRIEAQFSADVLYLSSHLATLQRDYTAGNGHLTLDNSLRTAVYDLVERSTAITVHIRTDLERVEHALHRQFQLTLAVSVLMLAGVCVALVYAKQLRDQAIRNLRDSEARWRLALEAAGDGIWDWNIPAGQMSISDSGKAMLGYADKDFRRDTSDWQNHIHPEDRPLTAARIDDTLSGRVPKYRCEYRIRTKDGTWKWVLSRGMVMERDATGGALRMMGTVVDLTVLKKAQATVVRQANYDMLTGLPNRRLFSEQLQIELQKAVDGRDKLAVLYIDLDHFKEVNDALGHHAGDLLLVEAARRLQACVRGKDMVSRQGGDEFIMLLPLLGDVSRVQDVAERILLAFDNPFDLPQESVYVSASIGISLCPDDSDNADNLLKNADQALYAAKEAGRRRYHFYAPSMQEQAASRLKMTKDLRTALTEQQFYLAYQPIVDLRTNRILKAEALVRWTHPDGITINPAQFIPAAERSGLIVPLGNWIFETAILQVKHWREAYEPNFQVSINKSPVQFRARSISAEAVNLLDILTRENLPGSCIIIEITEGVLLDAGPEVEKRLAQFRAAQVDVALDDFGTGYSSLSYLQKLDIEFIKIDRAFVSHLALDETSLSLCKAMITMAHTLGIQVVAEGVETQAQLELLREAGCDYGQGYFWGKPVRAEEFEAQWFSAAPSPGLA
jgi:diguanylate cyclase (GGDEF)-like protein/PAS domain S-box-containing protein